MRRNKLLFTALMLIIALIPTYLIIYQSIVATGLPDFDKQASVEIIYSSTAEKKTYVNGSDGYLALTTVLGHLSYVSALPADVETGAKHEITFAARDGGKSTYYLYGSKTELAFYLETQQGKYFRLNLPTATLKNTEFSPLLLSYYVVKNGAGSPSVFAQSKERPQNAISALSDLSTLSFDSDVIAVTAKVHGAGDALLAEYTDLSEIGTHENAEYVNLTVDFKLSETVMCRVLYELKLADG